MKKLKNRVINIVPKYICFPFPSKWSYLNLSFIFSVEYPEHDFHLSVLPSNNIKYNSKLGTELILESCDVLVCPDVCEKVPTLLSYLEKRAEDTSSKVPESLFPDKNGDNLLEIPNDAAYIFKALEEYYS